MMNALSVLLSVVFVSDPHHIQYYPVWYYRLVNSFFSFTAQSGVFFSVRGGRVGVAVREGET